jgi:hypothetical protein
MARGLVGPIPLGTPITDKDGTITPFFRQRWQDVGEGWTQTPTVAQAGRPAQTAALAPTAVWTATVAGVHRVSWYLRKTRADGVSSSATVTVGFLDLDGQALTYAGPALTLDSLGAWQGGIVPIRCLAPSDITVAVAYASATPGQMRYDLEVKVEVLP